MKKIDAVALRDEGKDSNKHDITSSAARIGVVLSSGGGRGVFAHTGFLLALEKLGIDIAAVAGCSAGALVGGIYASGTDLHEWLENIACVRTREYWSPGFLVAISLEHGGTQGARL